MKQTKKIMKKCERKTLCTSTTGHCTVKCTALQVTYTQKRPQIELYISGFTLVVLEHE